MRVASIALDLRPRSAYEASDLGVRGTPAFLVGVPKGATAYYIEGAQGLGRFQKLVERALKGDLAR